MTLFVLSSISISNVVYELGVVVVWQHNFRNKNFSTYVDLKEALEFEKNIRILSPKQFSRLSDTSNIFS